MLLLLNLFAMGEPVEIPVEVEVVVMGTAKLTVLVGTTGSLSTYKGAGRVLNPDDPPPVF